ncbi:ABC transporter permease [Streptomyces sparsogenes]|uniref:ABC transporter permease n=1 Tax=Streptomyces sparsogenes TaxID=67365 RepID=UPI0033CA5AEE
MTQDTATTATAATETVATPPAAPQGTPTNGLTRRRVGQWAKEQYPLYILIALLIFAGFTSDAFFSSYNLSNLLLQVSVIGIVTLAQFLIVLTGGIDISVGAVAGLAGVLSAGVFGGGNTLLAAAVAIVVGAAIGIFNGYLIAYRGLEAFIVTLGMLALARGLVYAYTEGQPITPHAADFRTIATTALGGIPVLGIIWIVLAVAMAFLTRRTVFGRRVYALGSSKEAAHAAGVPVKATMISVYVIAGVLVGFAGFLLAARIGAATPTGGDDYEIDSIAAVVIGGASLVGGRGRVLGAFLGTLIFGVISNLLVLLDVSTFLQDAFRGALIIFAVTLTSVQFTRRRRHTTARS